MKIVVRFHFPFSTSDVIWYVQACKGVRDVSNEDDETVEAKPKALCWGNWQDFRQQQHCDERSEAVKGEA